MASPTGHSIHIPGHLRWLVDTGRTVDTAEGKKAKLIEFKPQNDLAVLTAWAKHFRNQYCSDEQIDALRSGTKFNRAEYLTEIKFPGRSKAPGPSIRSGDFAEILVADYLEYIHGYWLPRTRYNDRTVRDESTKGCDIIGFKLVGGDREAPNDELALFESKADLAGKNPSARLQVAVDHSAKDEMRKAESLNAIKQRFLDRQETAAVKKVERFQNPEDRPYIGRYGAVALIESSLVNDQEIAKTTTVAHPHGGALILLVIHGDDLMSLVHALYKRAADEA